LAYLNVVCFDALKASAASTFSNPSGTTWIVDLVAHEMGHQLAAHHSFNGTTGFCNGNRTASTAWEPGSGTTIMSYSGSCGAENVQNYSDPWYHVGSHDEIVSSILSDACDIETSTGNNPPTVNAGPDYTIPQSTPFTLTASGSDPDGDPLTFFWEEYNIGTASPPNTDDGSRPIFRSFQPTTSPSRTFPQLSDILNNTTTLGESLPTTNRTLTFRVTARDNRTGGGGVADDSMTVTVSAASGPFQVTSPNTGVTWNGGTSQSVTWNVAGTSGPPVSTASVNILLSTDGGNSFPITLLASTPNDGSENITVPVLSTTTARVKVEAVDNIYFDISDTNFTISTAGCGTITVSPSTLPAGTLGAAYNAIITANGGASPYAFTVSAGSLPPGLTLDTDGSLTGTPTANGTYNFVITATDSSSCTGLRSYSITVACPVITFSPSSLPAGTVGAAYSQTLSANGAIAPVTFSILSGALPGGLSLNPSTGEISGVPATVQTANFTIGVADANGCAGSKPYTLTIFPVCLFCDDFEDGVLDPTWTYVKPGWSESGGALAGVPAGRKAIAVATPVFSGCSNCTVDAAMQTAGGVGNRVWLLAWYVDKGNTVELMMKEESNRWILKQRVNGPVVAKMKGVLTIDPNVSYDARITFDGAQFQVFIDNTLLITLPKAPGTAPFGTVGFETKGTTGTFGSISVN
ncbi:MAG TPA: putative Ig domain-containing protein, partial [Acidobacteriota bacterium]|nr:putative Ig domain-containing protein [Acidobacteriota bacterium]